MKRYKLIPSIRIESARIPVYLRARPNGDHGEYVSLPKQRITISPQGGGTLYSTLVHEALHAISDMHGLNLSERTIRALELGVVSLIVNNPKVIDGLRRNHV